jgi:hypothetical protein
MTKNKSKGLVPLLEPEDQNHQQPHSNQQAIGGFEL